MPNETSGSVDDFGGVLMPVQYYQLVRRHTPLHGEFRLLYAVLEDAIRCYVSTRHAHSRLQRVRFLEVRNWFGPRPPSAPRPIGLFAFEPLCEALGIEPEAVRRCLDSLDVESIPTRRHRRTSPSSMASPSARRVRGQQSVHTRRIA
jgi:hypothetical protein